MNPSTVKWKLKVQATIVFYKALLEQIEMFERNSSVCAICPIFFQVDACLAQSMTSPNAVWRKVSKICKKIKDENKFGEQICYSEKEAQKEDAHTI